MDPRSSDDADPRCSGGADPRSRRSLLRAGAGWLAAGSAAALSGCNSLSGDGDRTPFGVPDRTEDADATGGGSGTAGTTAEDRGVSFASLSPPDPAAPAYRRWLPPPSSLFPDRGGYRLRYARPFWVDRFASALPGGYDGHRRVGKLGLDHFGIGFENYQWVLRIDPWSSAVAAVVLARFDRQAVARTLTASGYRRAGTHRGLAVFEREDTPRAVALADGALVWSRAVDRDGRPTPRTVVEALVDAGADERTRYHEADEGFRTLSRAVGAPLVGTVHTGDLAREYPLWNWDLPGLTGWASTEAFDPTNSYLRTVLAFEGERDPGALRERIRTRVAGERLFRDADAVDVRAGPRSAAVVAAVGDDRYHELLGRDEPPPGVAYPQITWGYEYDPGEGTVTVTHRGGDAVGAITLQVDSAGVRGERQFDDEYDTVEAGDSVTVAVGPPGEGRVTVSWVSPTRDDGGLLGRYEVPGDGSS